MRGMGGWGGDKGGGGEGGKGLGWKYIVGNTTYNKYLHCLIRLFITLDQSNIYSTLLH